MKDLKKLTIKELRQKVQSNAPEAGRDPYIGLTIRFFSIYATKLFLFIRITPLQVTILSVLLFLSGVFLFVFHLYWLYFVGIFIIYISIILDGCNGELARLGKYRPDIGAKYIEPVSHDIQYALMFMPIAVGVYIVDNSSIIILIAFIATIAKLLQRFFIMRFDQIRTNEKSQIDTEGEASVSFEKNVSFLHRIYRFFNRNLFSSVGFIIPLLIFSIIDRIDLFIWTFALIYFLFASMHFLKQMRYVIKIDKPMV